MVTHLPTGVQVRVTRLEVTPRRVPLGGRCAFETVVVSNEPSQRRVRLEYVLTYG
jgi:hypothetical protein